MVMQDQPRQYLDRLIAVSLAEDASEIGSIVSGYGMQMINQDDETVLANLDRGLNRFGDAWEQMPTGAKSITRLWARGRRREQIAEADEEMLNAAIQVKVCGDIARSRGLLPE